MLFRSKARRRNATANGQRAITIESALNPSTTCPITQGPLRNLKPFGGGLQAKHAFTTDSLGKSGYSSFSLLIQAMRAQSSLTLSLVGEGKPRSAEVWPAVTVISSLKTGETDCPPLASAVLRFERKPSEVPSDAYNGTCSRLEDAWSVGIEGEEFFESPVSRARPLLTSFGLQLDSGDYVFG